MNKKNKIKDDEIDVGKIVLILWNEKIKIILITLIVALIGWINANRQSDSFLFSLEIQASQNSEFIKFIPLNQIIRNSIISRQNNSKLKNLYEINNKFIFDKFINEFMDFEELILILRNNDKIKAIIAESSRENQEQILADIAKSIVTINPKKKDDDTNKVILNFNWDTVDGFREILDSTLQLVLLNMKKSLISDIKNYARSIETYNLNILEPIELKLKLAREKQVVLDSSRLLYLKEQREIAKSLEIEFNQLDYLTLLLSEKKKEITSSSLNLDETIYYISEVPYYLRGYRVIDKEIDMIENRNFSMEVFSSSLYAKAQNRMNEINSDLSAKQLKDFVQIIENDKNTRWVDYNLLYLSTKSLNNTRSIFVKFIILGLIFGIFYVLITQVIKSPKVN